MRKGLHTGGWALSEDLSLSEGRELLWVAAFLSWRAINALSGYIYETIATGAEFDLANPKLLAAENSAFSEYVALLENFKDATASETFEDADWPKDVSKPGPSLTRDVLSTED